MSYDMLQITTSVEAPLYRFEWARSERAYREGDRHVALVRRTRARKPLAILHEPPPPEPDHHLAVGAAGCGQDVIPTLSEETTLFVGIAPVGFDGPDQHAVPRDPVRVDLGSRTSSATVPEFESTEARETPLWQLALGALLGLLLGWPIGLVLGGRIARRRR